jgi:hypothetical protein
MSRLFLPYFARFSVHFIYLFSGKTTGCLICITVAYIIFVPLKQAAGLKIVTAGYRADIDRVRFDQLLLKKPHFSTVIRLQFTADATWIAGTYCPADVAVEMSFTSVRTMG